MTQITLKPYELLMAASVGIGRQIAALRRSLPDQHGCKDDAGWQVHIEGACGEAAVAKALNMYWQASINTFRVGGDVGQLQVRTRSKPHYELIVREKDKDGDVFVLVTGIAPNYVIRGWMRGADAKKPTWLKTHGGRSPAWFVPHNALRPMRELSME